MNVTVIRDKREQTLTLTLPERKESGGMIEESFEAPELDAETQVELSEAQSEIAKLRPQIELAASKEIRTSLCSQQKNIKKQTDKLRQELGPKLQEELLKGREKMQREMEQFRIEMPGHWLDI